MKLLLDGEEVCETSIGGATTGTRCDAIELNLDDFRDLQHLSGNGLSAYLFEQLMTKLNPPPYKAKATS